MNEQELIPADVTRERCRSDRFRRQSFARERLGSNAVPLRGHTLRLGSTLGYLAVRLGIRALNRQFFLKVSAP